MDKVSAEVVVATIASVTLIWHVGMYAGILINRMKRLEDRTDDHERRIGPLERRASRG
jgi:hypothetical protein